MERYYRFQAGFFFCLFRLDFPGRTRTISEQGRGAERYFKSLGLK